MTATKLVLWRHGQTDFNVEGRVQGISDVPLNAKGMAQARAAAEELSGLGPLEIVTSKLARARMTANALAEVTGAKVRVVDDLIERSFGCLEGMTVAQMKAAYPDYYAEWRGSGECVEAGIEPRGTVGNRVASAIRQEFDATGEGRVLVVVSHGSALTQGLVSLLGLDAGAWAGIRGLDNCHWAEIIPAQREPLWRIASYNVGVSQVTRA
ncbi:MAG: histidine phosphatase family protein [Actinomycetaceae bacterium]|nr:histidine phosphatase family protein [Actinomycetaceae bacterium]